MERQDFATLVGDEPGLLRQVEAIVIEGHRRLHEATGKAWSKPIAYRWLRYEDPMPVARLSEGVRRLKEEGVDFDADAVEKARSEARQMGFSN
jgi:hypothetical protein